MPKKHSNKLLVSKSTENFLNFSHIKVVILHLVKQGKVGWLVGWVD
jgi:hypothetical protein